ncbi:MAG: CPBP family intramembrane metalloprotease [Richelia sp. CSU_2_1]|nr:CPBP family intramembrane metalloprotease [Richelia sp. CSU_2_1]
MNLDPSVANQRQISYTSLAPFLLMTFGLAWGILGLFILRPEPMVATFGKLTGQHPLFFLAVWAPAIAAFIVITYNSRLEGLRRYLSRLLLWRCSPAWYAFLLIGIPLLFFSGSALKGNLFAEPFPVFSVQSLMVALVLTAIKGPIEEFGWRGLALPLLQRKFAPIWSGLILGVIWGFWHLPAFLLSGTPQSAWSFTPFFVGSIALSVILTALFNASRGSILLPMLFHFQCNNPIYPDAQPYDTVAFVVAAFVIVWLNRTAMFRKAGATIDVISTSVNRANPSHA